MNAEEILGKRALRATRGRVQVLESLRDAKRPISAAEIQKNLGKKGPDLVTIYRNLERFVVTKIARRVLFPDGVRRYETLEGRHHHHLNCTNCGKITAIASCQVSALEDLARRQFGFRVTDHMLELYGKCQECQRDPQ